MKSLVFAALGAPVVSGAAVYMFQGLERIDPRRREAELAELRLDVAALREAESALARRVEALEGARPAPGSLREARRDEAAAAPAKAEQGPEIEQAEAAGPPPRPDPGKEAAASRAERLEDALEVLFDPAAGYPRRQQAWAALSREGLLDEAVAAFEARAREDPASADSQAELGEAYIQRLGSAGDLEKGQWAMKADQAFDAALALDPAHWSARFQKAVALSFWPAITGKQPESIRHFQVLLDQQEASPPRPEHTQSYLFLGNIHLAREKTEEALAVFRRGLALFPQDQALQARLREAEAAAKER